MVAPVDAKAELTVEGETFTLRLNFRTLALLEQAGLDPFSPEGFSLSASRLAMMCMCLTIQEHPELTDTDALAIVVRSKGEFAVKVRELFANFGGAPADESAEGKVKTRRPRRKAAA